ncbi:MAG: hypothetical protein AAFV29_27035, partial [Myxococcota bacterium]
MSFSAWAQPAATESAETASAPLRVGISPFPPFVIPGQAVDGYSIELWKQLAKEIGREYEFVTCTGAADFLGELLPQLDAVAIDGLAGDDEGREGAN